MPKVNGKEFPYTEKGKAAAKKFAKKSGKKWRGSSDGKTKS